MWAPRKGSRMVLASDGLWDYVSGMKACRTVHCVPLKDAPMELLRSAEKASSAGLRDDISILVLDIGPKEMDFSIAESSLSALKSLGVMLRGKGGKFRKARSSSLLANEDGLIDHSDLLDDVVPDIFSASISEEDSDEEVYSRNSSVGSDNWDIRESCWDCSLDSCLTWEKDERDILDTAEAYSSSGCPSACLKMITNRPTRHPVDRSDVIKDMMDASTTDDLSLMSTISEGESPKGMQNPVH